MSSRKPEGPKAEYHRSVIAGRSASVTGSRASILLVGLSVVCFREERGKRGQTGLTKE